MAGRSLVVAVGVAVLAVVPPAVLVPLAAAAARDASGGEPAPAVAEPAGGSEVATPLLSARRLPGVVTGRLVTSDLLVALEPLRARIDDQSCLAVDVAGRPVFAEAGDRGALPASNVKIVTAAAALERLGPDHRYTTAVVAPPVVDGRVAGDLVLVGGGDPLLSTAGYPEAARSRLGDEPGPVTSLEALADAVVAAGVREVTGGVLGDDSRYDGERAVPTWPASYQASFEVGVLGALVVDDGFESFAPFRLTADPAVHAAGVLTNLLRERGVAIGAGPGRAGAPVDQPILASVESVPMSAVVAQLLTESDNSTAELVLKELSVAAGSRPGTREGGLAAVQETLAAWQVPTDGLVLTDGSGLDRGNRLSCRTLAAVLDRQATDGALVAGLPVAGRNGTLADRFGGNPMEGVLRAKTGTLSGARALSGVVPTEQVPPVVFSLLLNGPGADSYARTWDLLGRALAAYPSRPDLAPFAPQPPRSR